jgi:hypothetical protein
LFHLYVLENVKASEREIKSMVLVGINWPWKKWATYQTF